MKYEDIKMFSQRCEEHPDHQTGMVSERMIQQRLHEEIDELREYIEQAQKQEPVGFMCRGFLYELDDVDEHCETEHIYLYTQPQEATPRKPWVGLTNDEVRQMCGSVPSMKEAVREAEAKLKGRNT